MADPKKYLMRKDEERRGILYSFKVNDQEQVTTLELIPTIGRGHSMYERTEDSRNLKTWKKTRILDEKDKEDGKDWHETEPTLVDRLRVADPIVRDAFNPGTTAGNLFMQYGLIADSGYRM